MDPPGQSQNVNRRVQLGGDHNLQGCVPPDIRALLTRETVYVMSVEGEDVVPQHAIEALQAR